jgi:hypothetical protein
VAAVTIDVEVNNIQSWWQGACQKWFFQSSIVLTNSKGKFVYHITVETAGIPGRLGILEVISCCCIQLDR